MRAATAPNHQTKPVHQAGVGFGSGSVSHGLFYYPTTPSSREIKPRRKKGPAFWGVARATVSPRHPRAACGGSVSVACFCFCGGRVAAGARVLAIQLARIAPRTEVDDFMRATERAPLKPVDLPPPRQCTLHCTPVGQGSSGPAWLVIALGFWSGRVLATGTGTAWAGCFRLFSAYV